jgi:hypothetical protein
MPDDEYVMGWIDVDFDHAKEKLSYVVHSRDIQNNKYDNYSEGFRTKVSTLAHVGLKNAKKYLRRFSHGEVALASIDKYKAAAHRYRNLRCTQIHGVECLVMVGIGLWRKHVPPY